MLNSDLVNDIKGVERAAILLLALGEESASSLLSYMGPKEAYVLGVAMARLANVTPEQTKLVMRAFSDSLETHTGLGIDSEAYVRNVLTKAHGAGKAKAIINRIFIGGDSKSLEQLKWTDARTIARMIESEHPQITAIVLSFLDAELAAEVLNAMSRDIRSDMIQRIAELEDIQPSALQELDRFLEKQLADMGGVSASTQGGVKSASDIFNLLDDSDLVMERIAEKNSDLAHELRALAFVFENLADLTDKDLQILLSEIKPGQLKLALRGTDARLAEKIFNNLPGQAAERLRNELATAGPARAEEIESAQKAVVDTARWLAGRGAIRLASAARKKYP